MLTRITAVLFATLSFAGSAFASAPTRTEVVRHYNLMTAVQRAGTEVFINHPVCEDTGADGMYYPGPNVLVICQDNAKEAKKFDGKEVEWTYNDLDTIRHETQHMIQDCAAGYNNGDLTRIVKDDARLATLGFNSLGEDGVRRIIQTYGERGASEHVIGLEIEAFSVAAAIAPEGIIEGIEENCPMPPSQS